MIFKEVLRKEVKKAIARKSFYDFCQTLAPEYYTEDKIYLKEICETLQALYEGRILIDKSTKKKLLFSNSEAKEKLLTNKYTVCKKVIMNIPPQHGKSRTLVNFSAWVFGVNSNEKIITASYNDSLASDFSRFTRDTIQMEHGLSKEIIYSDIFRDTKIKRGDAAFKKWALEGKHFSYMGSGIGGTITGKGGTILIVDDPIKGAEEAFNEEHLEKVWLWYTSTFLSRVSAEGGEPIEIVNHTRWATNDVCGKILSGDYADEWYVLKMPAMNEDGEMLCEKALSKKRYNELKGTQDEKIFNANYQQEPFDEKNKLFELKKEFSLKELKKLQTEEKPIFENVFAYIDVADEGNDYLAAAFIGNIGKNLYLIDVVYSQANTDITLGLCRDKAKETKARKMRVEANSMGAMFGRELQKLLPNSEIYPITNTVNKITRITMEQYFIEKHLHILKESEQSPQYKAFIASTRKFTKDGKNKNDDAPDCLSGGSQMAKILLYKEYEN